MTTRVDFYVLSQAGEQARSLFACKLAEKAWRLENTVHIHTADASQADAIDRLLWTFRDGSFVPHHVIGKAEIESPVTIGSERPPTKQLLINLGAELPEFAGSFERVAEVVTADEDSRQRSRERFARYREQGFSLETHKL